MKHRFHNVIAIFEDFVVPETENGIAARRKKSRSRLVAYNVRRLGVVAAIELDDEPRAFAGKVGDVRADACLAAEMKALPPEQASCRRAVARAWRV